MSLEQKFLEELKAKNQAVAVFLVNGIKLQGVIDSYDEEVLLLKGLATQIVFKHAISTVVPVIEHKALK